MHTFSRYIAGLIGVIIAVVLIAFRSVISYSVASKMNPQFAELAGASAVAMVIFGAIGLLFAHELWQSAKSWFCPRAILAAACVMLTIAAEAYITRLDIRFQVAGQADVTASRIDQNARSADTKAELAKARNRRDALTAKKTLSWIEREDLEGLNDRIKTLESKWDTTVVNAGGMPEASFMARWSHDEEWWEGALMIAQLIFWPLVGMFALPIAIIPMQEAVRKPHPLPLSPEERVDLPAAPIRPVELQPIHPNSRLPLQSFVKADGARIVGKTEDMPAELVRAIIEAKVPDEAKHLDHLMDDVPPPTDGGTPVATESSHENPKIQDLVETPAPFENVVTTKGEPWEPSPKLTKGEQKRLRLEARKSMHCDGVRDFIAARLNTESDAAQFQKNPNGRGFTGGTEGKDVYREYRRWCDVNKLSFADNKYFGEYLKFHGVKAGKKAGGVQYACTILEIKENSKRKRVA